MTLFSVVGGFAARGSQVFEKVEEDMSKLMEIKLRDNLTRGQARWESHKAEKKAKRTLAKTLKSNFSKDIKINASVDESLIGGMIVKVGSRMIDTTIQAKLNSLQNVMKEVG